MGKKNVPDFYMAEADLPADVRLIDPVSLVKELMLRKQIEEEAMEDALNEAWLSTKH